MREKKWRVHPWTLRFEVHNGERYIANTLLEESFVQQYYDRYLRRLRFGILMFAIVCSLQVIDDLVFIEEYSSQWILVLLLRFSLFLPVCLLVFAMTFFREGPQVIQIVSILLFLLGMIMIAYSIVGKSYSYGPLALLFVVLFAFSPVPVLKSFIISAVLVVLYGVSILTYFYFFPLATWVDVMVYTIITLVCCCAVLTSIKYILEAALRHSFQEEYQMAQEAVKYHKEKHTTARLLESMLPAPVIARLVEGDRLIAETLPNVSVLFCETNPVISRKWKAGTVVFTLNVLYSALDNVLLLTQREFARIIASTPSTQFGQSPQYIHSASALKLLPPYAPDPNPTGPTVAHHLRKIETVGEVYLAAGGVPIQHPLHALMTLRFALHIFRILPKVRSYIYSLTRDDELVQAIQVRIGIHSGPVAAGVVGIDSPRYKLVGDTVNTASRLQSTGTMGRLQVSVPFALNVLHAAMLLRIPIYSQDLSHVLHATELQESMEPSRDISAAGITIVAENPIEKSTELPSEMKLGYASNPQREGSPILQASSSPYSSPSQQTFGPPSQAPSQLPSRPSSQPSKFPSARRRSTRPSIIAGSPLYQRNISAMHPALSELCPEGLWKAYYPPAPLSAAMPHTGMELNSMGMDVTDAAASDSNVNAAFSPTSSNAGAIPPTWAFYIQGMGFLIPRGIIRPKGKQAMRTYWFETTASIQQSMLQEFPWANPNGNHMNTTNKSLGTPATSDSGGSSGLSPDRFAANSGRYLTLSSSNSTVPPLPPGPLSASAATDLASIRSHSYPNSHSLAHALPLSQSLFLPRSVPSGGLQHATTKEILDGLKAVQHLRPEPPLLLTAATSNATHVVADITADTASAVGSAEVEGVVNAAITAAHGDSAIAPVTTVTADVDQPSGPDQASFSTRTTTTFAALIPPPATLPDTATATPASTLQKDGTSFGSLSLLQQQKQQLHELRSPLSTQQARPDTLRPEDVPPLEAIPGTCLEQYERMDGAHSPLDSSAHARSSHSHSNATSNANSNSNSHSHSSHTPYSQRSHSRSLSQLAHNASAAGSGALTVSRLAAAFRSSSSVSQGSDFAPPPYATRRSLSITHTPASATNAIARLRANSTPVPLLESDGVMHTGSGRTGNANVVKEVGDADVPDVVASPARSVRSIRSDSAKSADSAISATSAQTATRTTPEDAVPGMLGESPAPPASSHSAASANSATAASGSPSLSLSPSPAAPRPQLDIVPSLVDSEYTSFAEIPSAVPPSVSAQHYIGILKKFHSGYSDGPVSPIRYQASFGGSMYEDSAPDYPEMMRATSGPYLHSFADASTFHSNSGTLQTTHSRPHSIIYTNTPFPNGTFPHNAPLSNHATSHQGPYGHSSTSNDGSTSPGPARSAISSFKRGFAALQNLFTPSTRHLALTAPHSHSHSHTSAHPTHPPPLTPSRDGTAAGILSPTRRALALLSVGSPTLSPPPSGTLSRRHSRSLRASPATPSQGKPHQKMHPKLQELFGRDGAPTFPDWKSLPLASKQMLLAGNVVSPRSQLAPTQLGYRTSLPRAPYGPDAAGPFDAANLPLAFGDPNNNLLSSVDRTSHQNRVSATGLLNFFSPSDSMGHFPDRLDASGRSKASGAPTSSHRQPPPLTLPAISVPTIPVSGFPAFGGLAPLTAHAAAHATALQPKGLSDRALLEIVTALDTGWAESAPASHQHTHHHHHHTHMSPDQTTPSTAETRTPADRSPLPFSTKTGSRLSATLRHLALPKWLGQKTPSSSPTLSVPGATSDIAHSGLHPSLPPSLHASLRGVEEEEEEELNDLSPDAPYMQDPYFDQALYSNVDSLYAQHEAAASRSPAEALNRGLPFTPSNTDQWMTRYYHHHPAHRMQESYISSYTSSLASSSVPSYKPIPGYSMEVPSSVHSAFPPARRKEPSLPGFRRDSDQNLVLDGGLDVDSRVSAGLATPNDKFMGSSGHTTAPTPISVAGFPADITPVKFSHSTLSNTPSDSQSLSQTHSSTLSPPEQRLFVSYNMPRAGRNYPSSIQCVTSNLPAIPSSPDKDFRFDTPSESTAAPLSDDTTHTHPFASSNSVPPSPSLSIFLISSSHSRLSRLFCCRKSYKTHPYPLPPSAYNLPKPPPRNQRSLSNPRRKNDFASFLSKFNCFSRLHDWNRSRSRPRGISFATLAGGTGNPETDFSHPELRDARIRDLRRQNQWATWLNCPIYLPDGSLGSAPVTVEYIRESMAHWRRHYRKFFLFGLFVMSFFMLIDIYAYGLDLAYDIPSHHVMNSSIFNTTWKQIAFFRYILMSPVFLVFYLLSYSPRFAKPPTIYQVSSHISHTSHTATHATHATADFNSIRTQTDVFSPLTPGATPATAPAHTSASMPGTPSNRIWKIDRTAWVWTQISIALAETFIGVLFVVLGILQQQTGHNILLVYLTVVLHIRILSIALRLLTIFSVAAVFIGMSIRTYPLAPPDTTVPNYLLFLALLSQIGPVLAYEHASRMNFLRKYRIQGEKAALEAAQARSYALLVNLLPASIAERLQALRFRKQNKEEVTQGSTPGIGVKYLDLSAKDSKDAKNSEIQHSNLMLQSLVSSKSITAITIAESTPSDPISFSAKDSTGSSKRSLFSRNTGFLKKHIRQLSFKRSQVLPLPPPSMPLALPAAHATTAQGSISSSFSCSQENPQLLGASLSSSMGPDRVHSSKGSTNPVPATTSTKKSDSTMPPSPAMPAVPIKGQPSPQLTSANAASSGPLFAGAKRTTVPPILASQSATSNNTSAPATETSMVPKTTTQTNKKSDQEENLISDAYPEISILWSDLVGFTSFASNKSPMELIAFLNSAYASFDRVLQHHTCRKIEVLGDAFFVVSGAPEYIPDHSERAVSAALYMQQLLPVLRAFTGEAAPLALRVGVHVGAVVAGVVGRLDSRWHLFGRTPALANLLESSAAPGSVVVSHDAYVLLRARQAQRERSFLEAVDTMVLELLELFDGNLPSELETILLRHVSRTAHANGHFFPAHTNAQTLGSINKLGSATMLGTMNMSNAINTSLFGATAFAQRSSNGDTSFHTPTPKDALQRALRHGKGLSNGPGNTLNGSMASSFSTTQGQLGFGSTYGIAALDMSFEDAKSGSYITSPTGNLGSVNNRSNNRGDPTHTANHLIPLRSQSSATNASPAIAGPLDAVANGDLRGNGLGEGQSMPSAVATNANSTLAAPLNSTASSNPKLLSDPSLPSRASRDTIRPDNLSPPNTQPDLNPHSDSNSHQGSLVSIPKGSYSSTVGGTAALTSFADTIATISPKDANGDETGVYSPLIGPVRKVEEPSQLFDDTPFESVPDSNDGDAGWGGSGTGQIGGVEGQNNKVRRDLEAQTLTQVTTHVLTQTQTQTHSYSMALTQSHALSHTQLQTDPNDAQFQLHHATMTSPQSRIQITSTTFANTRPAIATSTGLDPDLAATVVSQFDPITPPPPAPVTVYDTNEGDPIPYSPYTCIPFTLLDTLTHSCILQPKYVALWYWYIRELRVSEERKTFRNSVRRSIFRARSGHEAPFTGSPSAAFPTGDRFMDNLSARTSTLSGTLPGSTPSATLPLSLPLQYPQAAPVSAIGATPGATAPASSSTVPPSAPATPPKPPAAASFMQDHRVVRVLESAAYGVRGLEQIWGEQAVQLNPSDGNNANAAASFTTHGNAAVLTSAHATHTTHANAVAMGIPSHSRVRIRGAEDLGAAMDAADGVQFDLTGFLGWDCPISHGFPYATADILELLRCFKSITPPKRDLRSTTRRMSFSLRKSEIFSFFSLQKKNSRSQKALDSKRDKPSSQHDFDELQGSPSAPFFGVSGSQAVGLNEEEASSATSFDQKQYFQSQTTRTQTTFPYPEDELVSLPTHYYCPSDPLDLFGPGGGFFRFEKRGASSNVCTHDVDKDVSSEDAPESCKQCENGQAATYNVYRADPPTCTVLVELFNYIFSEV